MLIDLVTTGVFYISPALVGAPLLLGTAGVITAFADQHWRLAGGFVALGVGWALVSAAAAVAFFVLGMAHCCRDQVRWSLFAIAVVYVLLAVGTLRWQLVLIRRHLRRRQMSHTASTSPDVLPAAGTAASVKP